MPHTLHRYGPIPEPATMLLFGTCLVGLIGITIRR
ncbi:MAG: PEP-CTERM sorting domain-containing protein [Desulfobulbaceae bacterium]|nr:PEP-CTERM sorting domain-containing protein [Desulfobulbaceae bacterium]